MARKFERITLYGAGLIGAGWATHLLVKGFRNITMFDINEAGLGKGMDILRQNLTFLAEEKVLDAGEIDSWITSIRTTTSVKEAVADADLIIENGPEILTVKQGIIAAIESECRDDAVITSSTSGILISDIVCNARHPERIFGAHPYHPVYLLPLLEIVKSELTDPGVLADAMDFFRSIDKKPVLLKKESDGYIGSHLMTTLLRESTSMILNGVCTMEDIDDAFTYGPGMRYGLFGIYTTLQLGGGASGIQGMLCGPIGQSTDKWLGSFCNWQHWPPEAKAFFANCQEEMDRMLSARDELHGRNNQELEVFRDKGLVKLLQAHGMI